VTGGHHHGHSHHHHGHAGGERARLTSRAALASITMALFLVAIKTYASWDTGSVAMLGSLADTTLDFIASLVTFFGVRWAAMPADEEHRYGHGKAEALAALIQVILIAFSALGIAWRAFDRLRSGQPTEGLELGVGVSVIAMIATVAMLGYQRYFIR
jgi:ferrous-iron efflux pump FieF